MTLYTSKVTTHHWSLQQLPGCKLALHENLHIFKN